MITVKVLGPGCRNCERLDAAAREAAASEGLDAAFIKVTDYGEIMAYNVLATPGLVINEQLVAAGRIPSTAEIQRWLREAEVA